MALSPRGDEGRHSFFREFPYVPLEDALRLVRFYAERRSPNYEKAAMRWLERLEITASLAGKPLGGRASDVPRSSGAAETVPA